MPEKKKIFPLLMAVCALLLALCLAGCGQTGGGTSSGSAPASTAQKSAGQLMVKVLNVGQGDAILIRTAEQTVLIDTSDVDERDKLRRELQANNVKKIDKLILTHPHADHIGGMDVVLADCQIGTVYDNGMPSTSKLYLNYRKALKAKGIEHKTLQAGDVLELGGNVQFRVLAPSAALVAAGNKKGYKHHPNNESIVGQLVYGDFKMMLTGDAEKQEEDEILAAYKDSVASQVLKAGHHGSKTSSSKEWLRAVKPEAALISCGAGNDYGHPHKETLKKYQALKLKIFETNKNGAIMLTSDGHGYKIEPSEGGAQ